MLEIKEKVGSNYIDTGIPEFSSIADYTINCEDMGRHTLSTNLSLPIKYVGGVEAPITFKTSFCIQYNNDIYFLNSEKPTGVKDNEKQNINYTLIFESRRNKLDNIFAKNVSYVYKRDINGVIDTANPELGIEFTSPASFYGNIYDFILFIRKNLDYIFGLDDINIKLYDVDIEDELTDTSYDRSKMFNLGDLSSTSLFQILAKFNEESKQTINNQEVTYRFDFELANDTYWIIIDKPIQVVTKGNGSDKVFLYGGTSSNGGLLSITRTTDEQIVPNRIYGVGGNQNLPVNYYAIREHIDTESGNNIIVETLPANPDTLKTYLILNTEYPDAYDCYQYIDSAWVLISKLQERREPFPRYLSYYSNLMPKCFREYLEGWKIGYSGLEYNPPLPPFSDEFWKGYNDGRSTFQGNETYKPITFYQDDESIAKYGVKDIKQDFEDIYPSIIEQYAYDNGQPLGRLDEIVDVYIPPTGKYWEDTDNIVTNQYGNRINLKVPFAYCPLVPEIDTFNSPPEDFMYYHTVGITPEVRKVYYFSNGQNRNIRIIPNEVTIHPKETLNFGFKLPVRVTSSLYLYKDDGTGNYVSLKFHSGTSEPAPITYFSKNGEVSSGYKFYFIENGVKKYWNGVSMHTRITYAGGGYSAYPTYEKLTADEAINNNARFRYYYSPSAQDYKYNCIILDTEKYTQEEIDYLQSQVWEKEVVTISEFDAAISLDILYGVEFDVNGDFKLELRVGTTLLQGISYDYYGGNTTSNRHSLTIQDLKIERGVMFDYTTKSFFIWTKNLFFNPMDDRWSGAKDKNVLFTFQNGKLAGNKFAIAKEHSLGGNNGVFVRTDKTLATTNQEGNSINAPSYYCVELKHIINDATNTENDANLFPEIPRGNLIPAKKDLFIIEGIRYPYEPYVLSAEQKLEDRLKKELNKEARYSYSIVLDHIAIQAQGIDFNKLRAGNKIKIRNNSLAGTNDNNYAELTIKSVQIAKTNDQQLDRYVLNVSNLTYRRNLTRPSITDRGITTTFDRDIAILDREIGSLRDVANENNRTTNNLTTTLGGIPRGTDIGTILGDVNLGRKVFGSDLSLESDINFNRTKIILNAKKINTKNKRLTTLVDEKDKSLLSFFADSKQDPISVTPKIELDGAKLILTEQQVIFDYDKTTSFQLDPQEVDLDLTDIQYIYAVCDTDTSNATLIAYNDFQNFEEDTKRKYLVGYVNPVLDEIPVLEYAYLGDKKLDSGTINLPPIPVNSEERYKYINHRLGRKPDVQLVDESGEIRYVQVIHLSDDSLQLSWVGSIAGSVIIE